MRVAALLMLMAASGPAFAEKGRAATGSASEPTPAMATAKPTASEKASDRPWPGITAEMDRLLTAAIDAIFDMRFDEAESFCQKAMALEPGHPAAHFGLAGAAWTRYVYGADQSDPSLIPVFEAKVAEVARVGDKWLDEHPKDAGAMMIVGAIHGINSRLQVIRREWLTAYWTGRKAIGLTRAAAKLDPNFADAYLGVGMYDYYADLYQSVVRLLAKLVLGGNRLRGIATLEKVAREGHFTKACAQILLVEIYTEDPFGARNPERAMELIKGLRRRYPRSAMMHSAQLITLYEVGDAEGAVSEAKDFIARAKDGRYNPLEQAKGQVALGCALWRLGKMDAAYQAFTEATKIRYNNKPSRWAVWGHFRRGQLLDRLGRREEALQEYRAVVAAEDLWGFRAPAKELLRKPYAAVMPGPIPPNFK